MRSRSAARASAIVLLGAGLGLAWNALSGRGFALDGNVMVKQGDEVVPVAAARARLEAGALALDARPIDFYDMQHIPGALPLPEDDFEAAFARLEKRLRASSDVIVYCAGFGCEASHIVSRRLKQRGIPAAILEEGWPAWQDAGYPVEEGPRP
jgi:rhodanese-related sulfurtransferase